MVDKARETCVCVYVFCMCPAQDQLVVVFCYTINCNACRAVNPRLALWNSDLKGQVAFFKFGLVKENKERAMEMGVKTAPTFLLIRNGIVMTIIRGGNNVHMAKQFIYSNR